MPATAEYDGPDGASAAISLTPPPVTPLTCERAQADPRADGHSATCWSTAEEAPGGNPRTIAVQDLPSVVVHTAGRLSCEPTATKSCPLAATASTRLEPPVSFMAVARVHLARSGDHQTSGSPPPP